MSSNTFKMKQLKSQLRKGLVCLLLLVALGITNNAYPQINKSGSTVGFPAFGGPGGGDQLLKPPVQKGSCYGDTRTDLTILTDFFNAIGRPKLSGWLKDPNIANWEGLTIRNNRVVGLILPQKNLSGVLPANFQNLTALEALDLSNNPSISGILNISCMASLRDVNMSNTGIGSFVANGSTNNFYPQLSSLQLQNNSSLNGTVDISQMLEIETLDASNTSLSQIEINPSGTMYANLATFKLFNSALTGTLDFAHMPELRDVDVSNNQFDELLLNPNIGYSSVVDFNIANNQFHGALDIRDFSRAETILASNNNFLVVQINTQSNNYYRYLKILDLSDNSRLDGTINISQMNVLETLRVTSTEITGFTAGGNTSLKYLYLHSNADLRGVLDITSMINLITVDAHHSGFQTIATSNTASYVNLRTLNLSQNALMGSVDISQMSKLQTFDISSNQIENLMGGINFGFLSSVNLANNLLTFDDLAQINNLSSIGNALYAPQAMVGASSSLQVDAGNPFSFDATTDQQVTNQYTWKKDGLVINGANNAIFEKATAEPADAGTYISEITNANYPALTLEHRPFTLNVNVPVPPVTFPVDIAEHETGKLRFKPAIDHSILHTNLAENDELRIFPANSCLTGIFDLQVQLRYDRGNRKLLPDWEFAINFDLVLERTGLPNTILLADQTLKLEEISADHLQTWISSSVYNDGLECDVHNPNSPVYLHIKSINQSAELPEQLYLDFNLFRKETNEFTDRPILLGKNDVPGVNKVKLFWALEQENVYRYELEWVYLDNFEMIHFNSTTNGSASAAFDTKEPVRVEINPDQYDYEMELTYPSYAASTQASVFYRIRAVGKEIDGARNLIYGAWNYGASGDLVTRLDEYQDNLNWQAVTTFAEEGKSKKVVNYLDGSLRNRQVLTDLSTNNSTLIGESFYDYEGRPSIGVLPVPVNENSLNYQSQFNQLKHTLSGGLELTGKEVFDNRSLGTLPMEDESGAAQYYSPRNEFSTSVHRDQIPDASGFVYSQTQYANDATGRVIAQSEVGEAFKLRSRANLMGAHVSQYYYATPNATQLHRLFGKNVGVASHYKKVATKDANGQITVEYLDQEGRTIATGLAGDSPENLEALDSYNALVANPNRRISESLIGNNVLDQANGISTASNDILNLAPDNHDFEYVLTTGTTLLDNGTTDPADDHCVSCVYELHLSITKPDGTTQPLGTVTDANGTSYDNESASADEFVYTITPQMCENSEALVFRFSAYLDEVGTYSVQKTLQLKSGAFERLYEQYYSEEALNTYIEDYWQEVEASVIQECEICQDESKQDAQDLIDEVIGEYAAGTCQSILTQIAQQREALWYTIPDHIDNNLLFPEFDSDDWWAEVQQHPEYCHYEACTELKDSGSIDFDLQMSRMETWSEALANAQFNFTNPLGMAGNPGSGTQDPFFTNGGPGVGFYGPMSDALLNMRATGTASSPNGEVIGSIWEITDPNASNPDLYHNGEHIFFTNLQPGETIDERRWKLFRSLYSGLKKEQEVLWKETSGDGCGFLETPTTITAGGSDFTYPYVIVRKPIIEVDAANGGSPTVQDYLDLLDDAQNGSGTINIGADFLNNISDEHLDGLVDKMRQGLEEKGCADVLGPLDWATIRSYLVTYFNTQTYNNIPNPLGLLFSEDLNQHPLSAIQGFLNRCPDGFSLTEIAQPNPMACLEEAAVYRDPIPAMNSRGSGAYSDRTNLGNINFRFYDELVIDALIKPDLNNGGSVLRKINSAGVGYDLRVTPDGRLTFYMSDGGAQQIFAQTEANTLKPSECQYVSVAIGKFNTFYRVSFFFGRSDVEIDLEVDYGDELAPQIMAFPIASDWNVTNDINIEVGGDGYFGNLQYVKVWKSRKNLANTKEVDGFWHLTAGLGNKGLDQSGNANHLNFNPYTTWSNSGCIYNEADYVCTTYSVSVSNLYNWFSSFEAEKEKCVADLKESIREVAIKEYFEDVALIMNASLGQYKNGCFQSPFDEDFTYEYTPTEYHYTLYYYDQAGSLVQTVPPKGVVPLDLNTTFIKNHLQNPVAYPMPATEHVLKTRYQYNSFGQLEWQQTPDAGVNRTWYDQVGNVRLAQNSKQYQHKQFTYTKLDAQNRVIETGQIETCSLLQNLTGNDVSQSYRREESRDFLADHSFPQPDDYQLAQIRKTFYDHADDTYTVNGESANFLRNRVAWTEVKSTWDAPTAESTIALYRYDVHGNVKTMVNIQSGLELKRLDYEYDLLSGNVHNVLYQCGQEDQFIHHYEYDADNRLVKVQTSSDGYIWDTDAKYEYYAHGPLARLELGEYEVQGLDFYYSLQGWIKGVNKPGQDPKNDQGQDGFDNTNDPLIHYLPNPHQWVSRDAFAYQLNYFEGDYQTIASSDASPLTNGAALQQATTSLYNGNIGSMLTDLSHFEEDGLQAMVYRYDQLNRIKSAAAWNTVNNQWQSSYGKYDAAYSYDAMGNLLSLSRSNAQRKSIDELDYHYYWYNKNTQDYQAYDASQQSVLTPSNRLLRVADQSGDDLGLPAEQQGENYTYDAIGNLTADESEGIVNVDWTIQGKVEKVTREDGSWTAYTYDAAGNRSSKTVYKEGTTTKTFYTRDAAGNIMAIYQSGKLQEQPIHGSGRIGQYLGNTKAGDRTLGNKTYELSNHLGNVLTVISDNKVGVDESGDQMVDFYKNYIVSATDYYPFGLTMEERSYQAEDYRYGFNGAEKDNSIADEGLDLGLRIYNPAIARMTAIDPRTSEYPWQSPYVYHRNSPVWKIDYLGGGDPIQEDRTVKNLAYYYIYQEDKSHTLKRIYTETRYVYNEDKTKVTVTTTVNETWLNYQYNSLDGKPGVLLGSYLEEPKVVNHRISKVEQQFDTEYITKESVWVSGTIVSYGYESLTNGTEPVVSGDSFRFDIEEYPKSNFSGLLHIQDQMTSYMGNNAENSLFQPSATDNLAAGAFGLAGGKMPIVGPAVSAGTLMGVFIRNSRDWKGEIGQIGDRSKTIDYDDDSIEDKTYSISTFSLTNLLNLSEY